jgi:hypothetical protein
MEGVGEGEVVDCIAGWLHTFGFVVLGSSCFDICIKGAFGLAL